MVLARASRRVLPSRRANKTDWVGVLLGPNALLRGDVASTMIKCEPPPRRSRLSACRVQLSHKILRSSAPVKEQITHGGLGTSTSGPGGITNTIPGRVRPSLAKLSSLHHGMTNPCSSHTKTCCWLPASSGSHAALQHSPAPDLMARRTNRPDFLRWPGIESYNSPRALLLQSLSSEAPCMHVDVDIAFAALLLFNPRRHLHPYAALLSPSQAQT